MCILSVASAVAVHAQTKVTGTVIDENGDPIPGASVIEVGSISNGVVTDDKGNFSLTVNGEVTIQFSCIGYVTVSQRITGGGNLGLITLQDDSKVLEQSLVVAFGKTTREAFTGSAGVLNSEGIERFQTTNAANALAGRVAGVQLTTSSQQPGSTPSITIRGIGSISSDTEPLIVLDGLPFDGNLNLINANDIESMTVLKDAASNALYGARGANGVIMITTKRGQTGEARITVDAKWGANTNGYRNYKTMNSKQFYETYYKMLYNYYVADTDDNGMGLTASDAHSLANSYLTDPAGQVGPGYMIYTVPTGQDFILQGGTMNPNATMGALYSYGGQDFWVQADDWEKEGLQNGFRQEYNVTVSGALNKLNYYASLGYLNQEGIQEGSNEERLTARVKFDYQAKKWIKVGANFNYTRYKYENTSEGTIGTGTIWSTIKTQAPIYPVYLRNADGSIMIDEWGEKMYDFAQSYGMSRANGTGGNCIFSNKYRQSGYDGNSFTAGGYAEFTFYEGLTLNVNANVYSYDRRYTYINSPFVDYYTSSDDNGSLTKSSTRTFTYNTQQLLNYEHNFGLHNMNLMLGHEYYSYQYNYLSASGYNFGIDSASELDALLNLNPNPSSSSSAYNNEGYFFRGLYNYAEKYYASVSYRRDASSRFAKDHRWGNFWSAGAAWIISKEPFFKSNWINELKFKFSVGSQGNDSIGDYLYEDSYDIVNNNDEVAYQWKQKGNEDITWETNTNWNAGVEFDLLNHHLSGSIDYFYRKTSDMLFSLNTPPSIGYTSYYVNLGDMRNEGVELDLHANIFNRSHFTWDVDFNISYGKNKVLRLPDDIKVTNVEGYDGYINLDGSYVSKYKYYVAEGLPLYTWYLPKYAGTDKETGEALYYMDTLDDDGNVIGRETTTNASLATDYLIGDAMAPVYGGLSLSFTFYGFDLSVNTNFQLGGLAYDYTYQTLMHTGGKTATNWSVDMLNAWTVDNASSNVPRLRYSETYSQSARSDRFLTSASYFNIQNINFGYTLPSKLTKKILIQSLRIYFSVENVGYFSARAGLDPRYTLAGYTNPELYSPMRTFTGGLTFTF
ncbi:MAG: SusC/RagA family TonB-linked outer membrane protein [Bacteroidales bacterium]|nr:SusC/RagA family TonB-linked outer membrane protein [Bacteroidales bacterium]